MSRLPLGTIGAVLAPTEGPELVETAIALEDLGFSTLWVTGGPLTSLGQIADIVRGTARVTVASGIISVDRFAAEDVDALYTDLERSDPGRFVVGLGGAHGPDPIRTLERYLDQLAAVPVTARVMAALGPRMLRLARERAAGAYPVLITPEYTARAREALGSESTLAVSQLVVVETDPERARSIARQPLGFLGSLPSYQASFRRMGFADDDIATVSDRLVDALVTRGPPEAIAAHVAAQQRAGADHVAMSLVSASGAPSMDEWRTLARALI
jgi:probable F420-dependent oxidoreductase